MYDRHRWSRAHPRRTLRSAHPTQDRSRALHFRSTCSLLTRLHLSSCPLLWFLPMLFLHLYLLSISMRSVSVHQHLRHDHSDSDGLVRAHVRIKYIYMVIRGRRGEERRCKKEEDGMAISISMRQLQLARPVHTRAEFTIRQNCTRNISNSRSSEQLQAQLQLQLRTRIKCVEFGCALV